MYILFLYQYLFTFLSSINCYSSSSSPSSTSSSSSSFNRVGCLLWVYVCVYCLSVMHRINTRNLGLFIYYFFVLVTRSSFPNFIPIAFWFPFHRLHLCFLIVSLFCLFIPLEYTFVVCAFLFYLFVKRETIKQFRASIRLFFFLHIYTTMTTINTGELFFKGFQQKFKHLFRNSNEIYNCFCCFFFPLLLHL